MQENYHLVCLKSALDDPAIVALRSVLESVEWQRQLATLPGYTPDQSGQVLSLSAVLPWWRFARRKPDTVAMPNAAKA